MNKNFLLWKKQALSKLDKSTIGSIDKRIKTLCDIINKRDDMFTLSSCSGRVCILDRNTLKKDRNIWLYITHDFSNFDDIQKVFLENANSSNRVNKLEFRQESSIIHICVENLDLAINLMHIAKQSGYNQTGIIALKTKIVIELICDAQISIPIFDKKLLIDEDYLKYLVDYANKLQEISWSTINKLTAELEKDIKE